VIDTHAHLDALEGSAAEALERARAAGVERVVTIGTSVASSQAALALARAEAGVYAALGIHPHGAGGEEATRLHELRALLGDERAVAVGETGLDHYRDYAPHAAQRRLFDAHLELASELDLPVVVHSRAAAAETQAALDGFDGTVVLHCFSEPERLPAALERGYYISFAGTVTYPNAAELRRAAADVPLDRLLLETDAPYLTPRALRGCRNEPAFLVHTLAVVAEVRGMSPAELGAQVDANADAAFSLR
jgi:TatD DNase family protein